MADVIKDGLGLRMWDMLKQREQEYMNYETKDPVQEIKGSSNQILSDINVIKLWINATLHPKNSKIEFFFNIRQTLLLMLSSFWENANKKDLLYAYKYYYKSFPTFVENYSQIHLVILEIATDPWENSFFQWEELFSGKLTVADKRVQDYFTFEPEEVVLARVHYLTIQNNLKGAMCLAKQSFLYHYRITKKAVFYTNKVNEKTGFEKKTCRKGCSSIDWFSAILQKVKSLQLIVKELQDISCHEGIEIIGRIRLDPKNKKFSQDLICIFLIQDLIKPSKYCCTKKLFTLFCMMHKEMNSSSKEISESAGKIFANHAPTSAHLYLFVDAAWEQFGTKYFDLYVEFYVRGLTADLNHLEASRYAGAHNDVSGLETHLASIFVKLATLFNGLHKEAARECMFSAFSLRPSKHKLFVLQTLTQDLFMMDQKPKKYNSLNPLCTSKDCIRGLRCDGTCDTTRYDTVGLLHPLLNKGIRNISYNLIKDFVSVLEGVRAFKFQYNVFDWRNSPTDLWDYLKTYDRKHLPRELGSDAELETSVCNRSDLEERVSSPGTICSNSLSRNLSPSPIHSSVKRKSNSEIEKETFSFSVGAVVEVENNDAKKRIKVQMSPCDNIRSPMVSESSNRFHLTEDGNNSIPNEEIMKKALSDSIPKGQSVVYSLPGRYTNPLHNAMQGHGGNKLFQERSAAYLNSKQINAMQEKHSAWTSDNSQKLQSTSKIVNSSHIPSSTSAFSKHNISRQSVVVAPESNTLNQRTELLQKQHIQKLPYSVHRSLLKSSDKYEQGALNLSSGSSYEKNKHTYNNYAPTSPYVPKQPINVPSSKPPSFSASTVSNHEIPYEQRMQPFHDRNSVIQHTMQHMKGKASPLPNQFESAAPIDSSNVPHSKSNSQSERSFSPFQNRSAIEKTISKSNLPLPAHLVIRNKPSHNTKPPSSTQPTFSNMPVRDKPIAASAVLSSPSSNTWGNNDFSKQAVSSISVTSAVNVTSVKKVYRKPYSRQMGIPLKVHIEQHKNGNTLDTVKTIASVVKATQSINQNFIQNSQQWTASNNSPNSQQWKTSSGSSSNPHWASSSGEVSSTHNNLSQYSHTSSSHQQMSPTSSANNNNPWYSSPYPSSSSASISAFQSQTSSSAQKLNLVHAADRKKLEAYPALNSPKYTQSVGSPRESISDSLLKSRLVSSAHSFTSETVPKTSSHLNDKSSQFRIKPSEAAHQQQSRFVSEAPSNLLSSPSSTFSSSVSNSHQLYDRLVKKSPNHQDGAYCASVLVSDNKGILMFQAANAVPASKLAQSASDNDIKKTCCSPFEVNPCDTCSPSHSESKTHPSAKNSDVKVCTPDAVRLSNKVKDGSPGNQDSKNACNSPFDLPREHAEDAYLQCQFCSFSCPSTLMKDHIIKCHPSEQQNSKGYNTEKDNSAIPPSSSFLHPGNLEICDTAFEDKQNDQVLDKQISASAEDDLNFYSMCYDILDNQDLSKLVNETGCLEQMDNSVPLMYDNESACNTSASSSYSEMVKSAAPLPDLREVYGDRVLDNSTSAENENPNLGSFVREIEEIGKSWSKDLFSDLDRSCKDATTNSLTRKDDLRNAQIGMCETSKDFTLSDFMEENVQHHSNSTELFRPNHEIKSSPHNYSESNIKVEVSENGHYREQQRSFYNCGICKKTLVSQDALQKHIAECYLKFANEAFEVHSPDEEIKSFDSAVDSNTYSEKGMSESEFGQKQYSFSHASRSGDSVKEGLSNPSQIFDFDPCLSDEIVKETYQSLQKGKVQIDGNDSFSINSEQNSQSSESAASINVRKALKSPTRPCKFCGKILTVVYMKQHISKMHSDQSKIPGQSIDLDLLQPSPTSANKHLSAIPNLMQEDMNSSTCLSASDALNSRVAFNVSDKSEQLGYDASGREPYDSKQFPFQLKKSEIKSDLSESLKSKIKAKFTNKPTCNGIVANEYPLGSDTPTERTLTSNKPENFKCYICLRTYTNLAYLKKHLKKLHNIESIQENLSEDQFDNQLTHSHLSSEIQQYSKHSTHANAGDRIKASEISGSNNSKDINLSLSTYRRDNESSSSNIFERGSPFPISHKKEIVSPKKEIVDQHEGDSKLVSENLKQKKRKTILKSNKCHLCPKRFSYPSNLEKHMKKFHSNQPFTKDNYEENKSHFPTNSNSDFAEKRSKNMSNSTGTLNVSESSFMQDDHKERTYSNSVLPNHPDFNTDDKVSLIAKHFNEPQNVSATHIGNRETKIDCYECYYCSEKYTYKADLMNHIELYHKSGEPLIKSEKISNQNQCFDEGMNNDNDSTMSKGLNHLKQNASGLPKMHKHFRESGKVLANMVKKVPESYFNEANSSFPNNNEHIEDWVHNDLIQGKQLKKKSQLSKARKGPINPELLTQKCSGTDLNDVDRKKMLSSKRTHKCPVCHKKFVSQTNVTRHMKCVHENSKIIFKKESNMQSPKVDQARTIHTDEKPVEQNIGLLESEVDKKPPDLENCNNARILVDEHVERYANAIPSVGNQTSSNENKMSDSFEQLISEILRGTEEGNLLPSTPYNSSNSEMKGEVRHSISKGINDEMYDASRNYEQAINQNNLFSGMNECFELSNQPNVLNKSSELQSSSAFTRIGEHNNNQNLNESLSSSKVYSGENIENSSFVASPYDRSGISANRNNNLNDQSWLYLDEMEAESSINFNSSETLYETEPRTVSQDEKAVKLDEMTISEQIAYFCKKDNECGICHKKLASKYNLQNHIRKKHLNSTANVSHRKSNISHRKSTDNVQYPSNAEHCNSSSDLQEKMRCPVCPSKLANPGNLKRHIKTAHPQYFNDKKSEERVSSSEIIQSPSLNPTKDNFIKSETLESGYENNSYLQIDQHPHSVHSGNHWSDSSQPHQKEKCTEVEQGQSHGMDHINRGKEDVGSLGEEKPNCNQGNVLSSSGIDTSLSNCIYSSENGRVHSEKENINTLPGFGLQLLNSDEGSMPYLMPEYKSSVENNSDLKQVVKEEVSDTDKSVFDQSFSENKSCSDKEQNTDLIDWNTDMDAAQNLQNIADSDIHSNVLYDNMNFSSIESQLGTLYPELKSPEDGGSVAASGVLSVPSVSHIPVDKNNPIPIQNIHNDSLPVPLDEVNHLNHQINAVLPMSCSTSVCSGFQKTDGYQAESLGEDKMDGVKRSGASIENLDLPAAAEKLGIKHETSEHYNSNLNEIQQCVLHTHVPPAAFPINDNSSPKSLALKKHVYSFDHNFALSVLNDLEDAGHQGTQILDQKCLSSQIISRDDKSVKDGKNKSSPCDSSSISVNNMSEYESFPNQDDSNFRFPLDSLNKIDCSLPLASTQSSKQSKTKEVEQTIENILDKVCRTDKSLSAIEIKSNLIETHKKIELDTCVTPRPSTASNSSIETKVSDYSASKKRCVQAEKPVSEIKKPLNASYSVLKNSRNMSKYCRLCQKAFRSMSSLSRHLKSVHSVPVLRKQNSSPLPKPPPVNDDKLSPPDLSLLSDSDSTSCPNKICESDSSEKEAKSDNTASFNDSVGQNEFRSSRTSCSASFAKPSNSLRPKISLKLKKAGKPSRTRKHSPDAPSSNSRSRKQIPETERTAMLVEECSSDAHTPSSQNKHVSTIQSAVIEKDGIMDRNFIYEKSALPKCIIKVRKHGRNSVSYQIDNSQKKESPKADTSQKKKSKRNLNKKNTPPLNIPTEYFKKHLRQTDVQITNIISLSPQMLYKRQAKFNRNRQSKTCTRNRPFLSNFPKFQSPPKNRSLHFTPSVPKASNKSCAAKSIKKICAPRSAKKLCAPKSAKKSSAKKSAKKPCAPELAKKPCTPELAKKPCAPESENVPCVSESENVPCVSESENVPCVSESENMPCAPESETLPCAPESETILCTPESETILCTPESETIPCAPESAKKPCAPESAKNSCAPESAKNSCVPETAKNSCVPESAKKPCVPDLSKKFQPYQNEFTADSKVTTLTMPSEKCTETSERTLCYSETFKGPTDIELFLKTYKQPLVHLTRSENSCFKTSNVDVKSNIPAVSQSDNLLVKQPVIVLQRITVSNCIQDNNTDSFIANSVPQNVSEYCSNSENSNEFSVPEKASQNPIKYVDSVINRNTVKVTLRENCNVSVIVQKINSDAILNDESSKKTCVQDPKYYSPDDEENCITLPSIRECCVLLNKLPV